ncbi:MAG TPA: hypothetical protein VJS44_22750 [Pyrinomonadaceae bacterium]|nr:hypothetical protein [Pyrinomonadaceae bacterium]
MMKSKRGFFQIVILGAVLALSAVAAFAQSAEEAAEEEEFGPVVRAYLGYLRDEQEVVDDRVSRREISRAYYRRNSNRIRALRQIAIRIARESGNDYLPELEAATRDEMKNLFDKPPSATSLRAGEVINNTFRYLGSVRTSEVFYIFARLDPYEQAELMEQEKRRQAPGGALQPGAQQPPPPQTAPTAATGEGDGARPRRATSP